MVGELFILDLFDDFVWNWVVIFLGVGVSVGVNIWIGKLISIWVEFFDFIVKVFSDKVICVEVKDFILKGDYLFVCEIFKDYF